jgi:hypothetical protein
MPPLSSSCNTIAMLTGFVILIQISCIFYSVNINSISVCFPVISARIKLNHRFLLCRIGSICPGRTNEKIRKVQKYHIKINTIQNS